VIAANEVPTPLGWESVVKVGNLVEGMPMKGLLIYEYHVRDVIFDGHNATCASQKAACDPP
jgi:hypothetical protein